MREKGKEREGRGRGNVLEEDREKEFQGRECVVGGDEEFKGGSM